MAPEAAYEVAPEAAQWLLIGNSRWHWASQDQEGWRSWHAPPGLAGSSLADGRLAGWAAVGPIPDQVGLDGRARIGLADIPLQAIREQIASAVHIVVQQARCPDGRRRVTDISEVTGIESGRVLMQSLFRLQSIEGRVPQHLASGHIPQFLEGIPNARSAGLLDLFGSAA